MEIHGPDWKDPRACEAVLRSLPAWFGIEESLVMYARDSAANPTFAMVERETLLGFLTLVEHFPHSFEVHCIAVRAEHRGRGIGRRLSEHAEAWLAARGVEFLQVKTIAADSPDPNYAETRGFYARLGYRPLEVFPTLWSEDNPCLQLVKRLGTA